LKVIDVVIFWVLITLNMLVLTRFDKRIKALELRCDGRCQYGDTACKAHCDKLGHCPMDR
jgi:hypothetical protein